jgi:type VI secretion system protein ImpH
MQLVRLYAGMEYDFDVRLVLKAKEVPPCRLSSGGEEGARLGWSSWLKLRDFASDAKDTILACNN